MQDPTEDLWHGIGIQKLEVGNLLAKKRWRQRTAVHFSAAEAILEWSLPQQAYLVVGIVD